MRARGCSTLPTAKLLRLAGQLQAVPCTTLVNSYHQLLASHLTWGHHRTSIYLPLLSFCVFISLSLCEALKLRSLPFTHPIYVASRCFH